MNKAAVQQFLETGGDFQSEYDFKKLSQYLIAIPPPVLSQEPDIPHLLERVMKSVHKVLLNEISKINESTDIMKSMDADFQESLEIPATNSFNYFDVAQLSYLHNKIEKYFKLSFDLKTEILNNKIELIKAMIPLVNYLYSNPMPILFRTSRLMSPADRSSFIYSRKPLRRLQSLRRKSYDINLKIHFTPPPFRSRRKNIQFLNNLIDQGLAAKKTGTTYFPELEKEDLLYLFLKLPVSPLFKEKLYPLPPEAELTPEYIKEWIDNATICVAAYLKTEDYDRADILQILLQRFIFTDLYPKLYEEPTDIETLNNYNKNIEKFRKKNPIEVGIKGKYIKEGYEDKPVEELFLIDENSKSPIDWINSSEFCIAPIDAAFCLAKAHEHLSMMCVLRAAKANHPSKVENFMDKMPGFDDIFEIWMAMMSACNLRDPFCILRHVMKYSNLPGYKGRLMSAITYLEASITQFQEENHE